MFCTRSAGFFRRNFSKNSELSSPYTNSLNLTVELYTKNFIMSIKILFKFQKGNFGAFLPLTLRFGGAIPPAFSDGIETVPRRYAVCYRNRWMIRRSDYVITHVSSPVGSGEAKFKDLAEKQERR